MFFFSLRLVRLGFATNLSPVYPAVLLLGLDLLGACDRLLRSLAGARVRVRALPADRESAAVADPLVTVDLDLALDVLGYLAPKVSFDLELRVDEVSKPHDLVVGQVPHARGRIDARRRDRLVR